MARDYKNTGRKPAKSKKARKGPPGWAWMLGGLAIGLFVALLVHLSHRQQDLRPARIARQAPALTKAPAPKTDEGKPPQTADAEKPRFEFYKLLPEMKVDVPKEQPLPTNGGEGEESEPVPAHVEAGQRYLLQAGSFRNLSDADHVKARLALLGVEADIQTAKLASGETWHRVRIGPMSNPDKIRKLRQRLHEQKIDTIVLKD